MQSVYSTRMHNLFYIHVYISENLRARISCRSDVGDGGSGLVAKKIHAENEFVSLAPFLVIRFRRG